MTRRALAHHRYDLVAGTNMVDYVEQLHEQAQGASKPNFAQLREEATAKFKTLQERAQPVMKVIEDPEAVAKLRSGSDRDKNLDMLRTEYNVGSNVGRSYDRSTSTMSMRSITLVNTNTPLVLTPMPQTISTTSFSSRPLMISTFQPIGENWPRISCQENGRQRLSKSRI